MPLDILNTDVVRHFVEPPASRKEPHNWFICGAGALRVVLAFIPSTPARWRKSPDPAGQAFMRYLAYEVQPPGPAWKDEFTGQVGGVFGHLSSGKPTNFADRMSAVANWEYYGEPQPTTLNWYPQYKSVFSWNSKKDTLATFSRVVEAQIRLKRVPVIVSLYTKVGSRSLPSWNRGGGHYVTIVGFNDREFFYTDTCGHSCRSYGTNIAPKWREDLGYKGHPGIWKVKKSDMHYLMRRWSGGYMVFTGPPQPLAAGY
jgi:hypothetical protein